MKDVGAGGTYGLEQWASVKEKNDLEGLGVGG